MVNKETILVNGQPEQIDNRAFLLKRIRTVETENRKWREKLGEEKEFFGQIASAVNALDPFPAYHFKPKAGKSPVSAVIKLSDWHIGERINGRETEGFGKYNWAIAQDRAFSITDDFINWIELQRNAYPIDHCAIFCEGDYVSGDIHDELRVTAEFPLPVQTANAGMLLGEVIRRIAGRFKRVDIFQNGADNHGRLVKKPQAKQKASNNMNHLVYTISNAAIAKTKNVTVINTPAAILLAKVNNWKFLLQHGDGLKSWMGIPFYGIQRATGREAARRMNTNRGFHYLSLGHYHVPTILEWKILVNGSLSGTTEFDHIAGRHAAPAQMAFLVHRKHGLFSPTVFRK